APRIALAGLPSQGALPRRPASLRAEALSRECDQPRGEADVARLGPDLLFWLLPCAAGAYNFASLPVLTDARGGSPRVVALPGVPGRPAGLPVNAAFEARTNRLTQFNKGRGIGDCGTAGTWGWAGDRFALLEWREMPDCRGIPDTDWIVLHRSPG
ncbi:MAG: DUF1176 domain-containing protein, partial [Acetobacteraceae bacterium]|nr:DUF1176 domain-containing protein [Acetobacteraceae bacterium]